MERLTLAIGRFEATPAGPIRDEKTGRSEPTIQISREGQRLFRCTEDDLARLAEATGMSHRSIVAVARAKDAFSIWRAREERPEGEVKVVHEATLPPIEGQLGRFGVSIGETYINYRTSKVCYKAELSCDGKAVLRCNQDDIRDLAELSSYMQHYLRHYQSRGRTLEEWCRDHAVDWKQSRDIGHER
jgi:hypothetical protein